MRFMNIFNRNSNEKSITITPFKAKDYEDPLPYYIGTYYEDYASEAGSWGFKDNNGKIVIKPQYVHVFETYTKDFIVIKPVKDIALWGIISKNGKVIVPPIFHYILDYEPDAQLVVVGEHEDCLGVYSLKTRKLIIPMEYDYISVEYDKIECSICSDNITRIFDYDGNEENM